MSWQEYHLPLLAKLQSFSPSSAFYHAISDRYRESYWNDALDQPSYCYAKALFAASRDPMEIATVGWCGEELVRSGEMACYTVVIYSLAWT